MDSVPSAEHFIVIFLTSPKLSNIQGSSMGSRGRPWMRTSSTRGRAFPLLFCFTRPCQIPRKVSAVRYVMKRHCSWLRLTARLGWQKTSVSASKESPGLSGRASVLEGKPVDSLDWPVHCASYPTTDRYCTYTRISGKSKIFRPPKK